MSELASKTELVERALSARQRAYAPYSKFQVGAALLLEDGEIIEGANIENSSFSLTICAERSAICTAISKGKNKFREIAIIANSKPLAAPCGACRQVIAEFAPNLTIHLANLDGEFKTVNLQDLLPMQFILKAL